MPPRIKDLDLGEGKKGWAVESRLWNNTAAKTRTAGNNSKQVTCWSELYPMVGMGQLLTCGEQ